MSEFTVKDSGQRQDMGGGMVRDTEEGKTDYTYVLTGPMLRRWAEHLMKGAEKYSRDNWTLGVNREALERYERSALRHLIQYLQGDRSEDHAAAVFFNLNGAEYVREQLDSEPAVTPYAEEIRVTTEMEKPYPSLNEMLQQAYRERMEAQKSGISVEDTERLRAGISEGVWDELRKTEQRYNEEAE